MTRRSLAIAALLTVLGSATACGQSSTTASTAANSASAAAASAAPSPSGNTAQVCDEANKIVTQDSGKAFGVQIGYLIRAEQAKNKTAEAGAKREIMAQADAWASGLRKLSGTATDPALNSALTQVANGLAALGTDAYLAKIKSLSDVTKLETDMANAGSGLNKVCH